jgi:hypothetical protein
LRQNYKSVFFFSLNLSTLNTDTLNIILFFFHQIKTKIDLLKPATLSHDIHVATNVYYTFISIINTAKPVLRGHLQNKEKMALQDR